MNMILLFILKKHYHRLVELNYKLGLMMKQKNILFLLGYNYQSSEWYEILIKF